MHTIGQEQLLVRVRARGPISRVEDKSGVMTRWKYRHPGALGDHSDRKIVFIPLLRIYHLVTEVFNTREGEPTSNN